MVIMDFVKYLYILYIRIIFLDYMYIYSDDTVSLYLINFQVNRHINQQSDNSLPVATTSVPHIIPSADHL